MVMWGVLLCRQTAEVGGAPRAPRLVSPRAYWRQVPPSAFWQSNPASQFADARVVNGKVERASNPTLETVPKRQLKGRRLNNDLLCRPLKILGY